MTESDIVYVVDDDPAVLHSVEALLSQYDYRVQCFSSATQFLNNATLDDIGCLISDVQMPVMNGANLLQHLQESHSTLAAIVVTGVADVPMAVSLMESGAVTLLEKPYDQSALLTAVAAH